MAKLLVLSVLVALSHGAPSGPLLAGAPAFGYAAFAPAPLTTVQETLHAGPPVAETVVHHGVVGSRTVQVGTRQVLAGHQYVVAGKSLEQQPAFSYVAGEPTASQSTVPIAPPAIPAPAGPIIPPAPRNLGPAPADTVTQEHIVAPVRTHTKITPQVRRIEPELQVNRVPVDQPIANPVPVEREVIYQTHVAKPYNVDVPQPYPVAQPYKVHPVHQVVDTPIIEQTHYTVHQPAVAIGYAQAAPAFAYAEAAPAVAVGYAGAPLIEAAPVLAEAVAVEAPVVAVAEA
jgi:hypothetical protein